MIKWIQRHRGGLRRIGGTRPTTEINQNNLIAVIRAQYHPQLPIRNIFHRVSLLALVQIVKLPSIDDLDRWRTLLLVMSIQWEPPQGMLRGRFLHTP